MQFTKTALLTLTLALSAFAQVPSSPASTSANAPEMTGVDSSSIESQVSSALSANSITTGSALSSELSSLSAMTTGSSFSSALSAAETNTAVSSILSQAGITGSGVSSALASLTGASTKATSAASAASSSSSSSGAGSNAPLGAMAGFAGAMLVAVGMM